MSKSLASYTLLLLLPAVTNQVFGQALSIDQFEYRKDTANAFLGNVGAYVKARKQKEHVFEAELNSHFGYLSKQHAYLAVADMDFNTVAGFDVVSQGYIHFRTSFLRKKLIIPEFFAQGQFDGGRGLDKRIIVGGGVKTHLINKKNTRCTFAIGAFAEDETWKSTGDTNTVFIPNQNMKITSQLVFSHYFNRNFRWYISSFYQFKSQTFLEPRVSAETFIEIKATKKLSIRTSYELQYDEAPIVEDARYTYLFKTGFFYAL